MKKLLRNVLFPILFGVALAILLNYTVFAQDTLDYTNPETIPATAEVSNPQPPVTDVEILEFVRSCSVQVQIRVKRLRRDINWYKLTDGNRLDEKDLYALNEDEKKWYAQGYKVEYGKYPKDKDAEDWLISGSGVIIYSQKYDIPILIGNELIYGETLGITNWHVVEQLVDYESRGTSKKPFNIYDERDKIITTSPPSVTIVEGARPIEQAYFKVDTQQVYIKHSEDQLYQVVAEIVAVDNAIDVAVFRIKNVFNLPYAVWRGTPPQVGEKVWICGAPLALRFSIDRGYINQVGLDLGRSHGIVWDDQIKLDIAAAPGSSGSGIFDIYGNLIAQEHGVLVYNGNYISGGHLATNGMAIREWLIWSGFAHTVLQPAYGRIFVTTGNIKLLK